MAFARSIAFAFAVAFVATGQSFAQAWPNKPIRLIAVFPPGGSVDQVARILAQPLSKQLGQIGVVFDTHGTNASLIPNIAYDTLKDLEHVTLIGTSPMALVASAKAPYSKMADVTAAARTINGIT